MLSETKSSMSLRELFFAGIRFPDFCELLSISEKLLENYQFAKHAKFNFRKISILNSGNQACVAM